MKKNILLIEDNPDDVKLTLRAFEKNKILNEIVVKTDGVEGMEYLNRCTLLPALVLLDLQLPRMGGIEVLRRIRTDPRLKLLPVVIMTSSREDVMMTTGSNLSRGSVRIRRSTSMPPIRGSWRSNNTRAGSRVQRFRYSMPSTPSVLTTISLSILFFSNARSVNFTSSGLSSISRMFFFMMRVCCLFPAG